MKLAFKTFGCRLNISETESIISQYQHLENICSNFLEADIVVINTCTVTTEAEKKCVRFINQMLSKGKFCISTGCFDPTKIIKNDKLIHIPIEYKGSLNKYLEKITCKNSENPTNFIENFSQYKKEKFLKPPLNKRFHSRAFLKIQDGCNHNCTYCKVHIVRGKAESLPYEKLIEYLNLIRENDFKEVILTGINIASYQYEDINFSKLLENLISLFPQLIFQLSSIEINYLDDRFFDIISCKNIKPYFHIPLQSGSNRILTLMNRPYKSYNYLKIIEKIKSRRKDSFISTDIIVGFPGENIESLIETENIIREIGFHHLHLFPFSKREGTPAYNYPETLTKEEKSYFVERFYNLVKENKNRYINSFIGSVEYFIVEKIEKNLVKGKTYHNIVIESFSKNDKLVINKGDYLSASICGKKDDTLIGFLR